MRRLLVREGGLVNEIRDIVIQRMKDKHITHYALAKSMSDAGVCSKETIYRWLRGTHDTTTAVASAVIDHLDMEVAPIIWYY